MSYWVAVVARSAARTVKPILDSILKQTLKPKRIIVVDDGSTDATSRMLSDFADTQHGLVKVITLPDRGYDIRRVPANINLASESAAEAKLAADFFMISGDDCSYPVDYAESLIQRMLDQPGIVVASGRPSSGGITNQEHTPSGSGRMVRWRYWKDVGGYPIRAGWETWLLYKAQEKGLRVKLFEDLTFDHARPRGAKHQFIYWGAAMRTLGYHPLYAVGRITKNTMTRSIPLRGSLNLLRGYLQAGLDSEDSFMTPYEPSLRRFIRAWQVQRMVSVIGALHSA